MIVAICLSCVEMYPAHQHTADMLRHELRTQQQGAPKPHTNHTIPQAMANQPARNHMDVAASHSMDHYDSDNPLDVIRLVFDCHTTARTEAAKAVG